MEIDKFKEYIHIYRDELCYADLQIMGAMLVEALDFTGEFSFMMIPYEDGIDVILALKGITRELIRVELDKDVSVLSIISIDEIPLDHYYFRNFEHRSY